MVRETPNYNQATFLKFQLRKVQMLGLLLANPTSKMFIKMKVTPLLKCNRNKMNLFQIISIHNFFFLKCHTDASQSVQFTVLCKFSMSMPIMSSIYKSALQPARRIDLNPINTHSEVALLDNNQTLINSYSKNQTE